MKTNRFTFAGPSGGLLSNCDKDHTRNLTISRTGTGQYTITFLTINDIDETEKAYPIIHVTCKSPSGTGTVTNVLNPTATYQATNKEGFVWRISFQIETINLLQALPVFTFFNIIDLLSGLFLVAFVDRPVVMVSCDIIRLYKNNTCECK